MVLKMAIKSLKSNFKNPTNRYGVASFWFLNGDLDTEELAWQVKEMKEKGLYGYVMHARYGRRVDYLSKEWFKRIDRIVKESAKYKMSAIIYDEDDWPSGMSGTKVLDDHPEYANKQLTIIWIDCKNKKKVETNLEIDGLQVIEGKVIGAFASKYEIKNKNLSQCKLKDTINITKYIENGRLTFNNSGNYELITVFINHVVKGYICNTDFPRKKGWSAQPDRWGWYFPFEQYVDLLDADAVDYFIKTTLDEYKSRFSQYFGNAITQVFTDEPGFYTVMKENKANAVPWTTRLPEIFKKKYGYNLIDFLPALLCNIGEKTARARYDFWNLITILLEENFIKKYHNWCKENNLLFTGHFRLCYPQLIWQRNYAGNVINLFRNMDIPGVDRLDTPGMCEKLGTKDTAWQIEDKILTSVAHQYKIERRMSESFALGGWGYRFADMKRITDWQYMMGINFIIPHAFHYSISGQRKRECPPTEFYQNPMWENYKHYSDYTSRLGEMMIGGVNVADVAILYPMTSLWTDDVAQPLVDDLPNNIDRDFGFITDCLLRENIDYDVIGEEEFLNTKIENKKISIGDAKYSLLVIPPMLTIRKETEKKLIDFIENGGKVLILSLPPFKDINGEELRSLNKLVEDEFGYDYKKLLDAYSKNVKTIKIIDQKLKTEQLKLIYSGVLKENKPKEEIVSSIEKLIDRDFKIIFKGGVKGNIYYNHHIKDSKDIYFIHNSDEQENYGGHNIEMHFRCNGKPFFYNPENGEIKEVIFYREVENTTIIPYKLNPLGSIFVVFDSNKKTDKATKKLIDSNLEVHNFAKNNNNYELSVYKNSDNKSKGYIKLSVDGKIKEEIVETGKDFVLELKNEWRKRLVTPNVLIIDRWKIIQNETPDMDLPPESWSSVFGAKQLYMSEFVIKNFKGKIKAVFDRLPEIIVEGQPQPVIIKVNNKKVENLKKSKFLDHDMKEADITDLVKIGKNYLEIEFDNRIQAFEGKTGIKPVSMMWDSTFIVGNFTLEKDENTENKYVIVKENESIQTKSWSNQGYPYFSGAIEYEKEFSMDKEVLKNRIFFFEGENNIREYMELYINNKYVDTRIWLPYKSEITNFLKAGKNKIKLIVRNTLKNIMEKRPVDSGIIGPVKIIGKELKRITV
jgi:hypothetical protein